MRLTARTRVQVAVEATCIQHKLYGTKGAEAAEGAVAKLGVEMLQDNHDHAVLSGLVSTIAAVPAAAFEYDFQFASVLISISRIEDYLSFPHGSRTASDSTGSIWLRAEQEFAAIRRAA